LNDTNSPTVQRIAGQVVVTGAARTLTITGKPSPTATAEQIEQEEDFRLGFDRGYTDGLRVAHAEAEVAAADARASWEQAATAQLEHALADTQAARDGYLQATAALDETVAEDRLWAESLAVELAFTSVLRLLGDKVADRSLIADLCTQARLAIGGGSMRLRLSPNDIDDVRSRVSTIELVGDDSLPAGSCQVETPRGRFDAGLDVRLELLRRALLDGLYAASTGQAP
jgi:flagellar assembly protein FliH